MLNHIVLMGRLTRDPEIRQTQSGVDVTSFALAVDRDFADETGKRPADFIDCVAWRNTAIFVHKYFSKGSMAVVSGRLQIRTWEDRDGNKRRTAEVVADNVYFGGAKKDGENGGQASQSTSYNGGSYGHSGSVGGAGRATSQGGSWSPAKTPQNVQGSLYDLDDDDGDLPF